MNDLPRSTLDAGTDDESLDRAARRLHALALEQVSPRTRTRLRAARQAAAQERTARHSRPVLGWALAAGVAVLAVTGAWQLQPAPTRPAAQLAAGTSAHPAEAADAVAELDPDIALMLESLEETPDFYLWLAANDRDLPAPPER